MPTSKSLFFVSNPHSGRGAFATRVREIQNSLHGRHPWVETASPRDATRLARQAGLDGFQTVVAVGGDGTVHEVMNGLMGLGRSSRPRLGMIPAGSGNDFAFASGLPHDLGAALEVVVRGHSSPVDIGSVDSDRSERTYWDNTVGIGFDARVTVRSRKFRKLRGVPMYIAATVVTLLREHHFIDVEFSLDTLRFSERVLMITLGNGPREGGGFLTTPHSRNDDGAFEMLLVKPITRLQMLGLLPRVLKGTHLESSSIFHHKFTTLHLASKQPLVIHADGEILARPDDNVRKIAIELHRNALNVVR